MNLSEIKKLVFVNLLIILSGCSYQKTEVRTPTFDEQIPPPRVSYTSGSIWQDSSVALAEDMKARRRGDVLTVVISEQASASKEASTGTKRGSTATAGIPYLMGLEKEPKLKSWMDLSKLINASYTGQFDGSGTTSRKENLTATITAKVVDVLPNGNLQIEGKRNVKVNNEDQVIVMSGTVRSRDIGSDNQISSAYVADARIVYSGKGIISDRQSPGWLANVLDVVWPF